MPAHSPDDHGRLVLVRHGETEWSRDGRHTGLTDLPLTSRGERDAASLSGTLRGYDLGLVLTSDLQRARRTAELAGLLELPGAQVEVDEDLREWDYGAYEGRATAEIREEQGPLWTVFEGIAPGATPGETVEEVAARGSRVIERVRPVLAGEGERGPRDVCLVGHGHALRILTAVWLRHAPRVAGQLVLDAGSVSVLGMYREDPCIVSWNVPARAGADD